MVTFLHIFVNSESHFHKSKVQNDPLCKNLWLDTGWSRGKLKFDFPILINSCAFYFFSCSFTVSVNSFDVNSLTSFFFLNYFRDWNFLINVSFCNSLLNTNRMKLIIDQLNVGTLTVIQFLLMGKRKINEVAKERERT